MCEILTTKKAQAEYFLSQEQRSRHKLLEWFPEWIGLWGGQEVMSVHTEYGVDTTTKRVDALRDASLSDNPTFSRPGNLSQHS